MKGKAGIALAAVVATTAVWLGIAHAGGKQAVQPQKGQPWAWVGSDGTVIAKSKDVRSVVHALDPGTYDIEFNGVIVGKCGFSVTTGTSVGDPRVYSVVVGVPINTSLRVVSTDGSATRFDSTFYILGNCAT